MMRFKFVTSNGSRGWSSDFTEHDTVANLKKDLEARLKIKRNNFIVFHRNHLLEEIHHLGKYGMRCGDEIEIVSTSDELNIKPVTTIEPIPEIQVGSMWSFRQQLIQSGVHMEIVSRISRNTDGYAVSLIVNSRYDVDLGHQIIFCGSEGRNKFGDQVADQHLFGRNESLVKNFDCNNWRTGIAIRVIRELEINEKSCHTGLATTCFRYDGYYKMMNYWSEKINGFIVWRFHLVRDDVRPIKWSNHLSMLEDTEKNKGVGPIPAIEFGPINPIIQLQVGTIWIYRSDIVEAGIHKDMVAGISTNAAGIAQSIVLSGEYLDNDDQKDDIFYTGCGPIDRKGNPTGHQKLERKNLALAKTCAVFPEVGVKAKNWKLSQPVMVIRKLSLANSPYKRSTFFRYDGIYRLIEYSEHKTPSSFNVWRFHLKRDDVAAAPWSKQLFCSDEVTKTKVII
ncbi:hypothetical protein TKK_0002803 [Trichogramma kaykai]|uniref:YDG domain-containing protein n=1 Tax=Trichogramma kaykai TaxID=54128 RepID=A0ABD2XSY6_9HYME